MSHPLIIPEAAQSDPRSLEMIRVWIAKGGLHISLNVGYWEAQNINESDAWGMLVADMTRHIANAHEEAFGRDPRATIVAIREAFEREFAKPTSETKGSFAIDREVDS
jgi:hypothetical protein